MAVLYNVTTSSDQADSVSLGLTGNWNDLGAIAPELPDTISPFIGSLEVCIPNPRCQRVTNQTTASSAFSVWE